MLSTTTDNVDKHLLINELEDLNIEFLLEEQMKKENISNRENKTNKKTRNVPESFVIRQIRLSQVNIEEQSTEDGRKKTLNDERTFEIPSSHNNDHANSDGLDIKNKTLDKKAIKHLKVQNCNGLEKETYATLCAKFVGMKNDDLHPLEGLLESKSDKKVQESLDTFIRQTMGHEAYMSFSNRPDDKSLQRIIEHQQAMDKCVKSLKVDINIHDGLDNNSNLDLHKIDIEKDPSNTKARQSIIDQNLQTIKDNVPLTVAALAVAATKNPDLSSWPLLSPLKVQLQKCEKCSYEFFSPLNHRRHTRTHHRRINYVDKEDLILKRKNIISFWNKLNDDEAQQIFENSRKYDLEDLSGEVVVSNLIAFKGQSNPITLPPKYIKAGQDLLDILDKRQRDFLSSEKILSILDEASERTFLCSQGEVNKIGLEEKNLVASLGYIVEQTLVKAWMVNKDAEALRNQQELFKEEEAAQMKRVKNVAKKKKKKEKSRQKVLKERKFGTTQLTLNEENESIDGENPSLEIIEEDNSPTASSTSANSSGLENQLLETSETEDNMFIQNLKWRNHDVCGEDGHLQKLKDTYSIHMTSPQNALDHVTEDQMQLSNSNIISNGDDQVQYSKSPSINQDKVEDCRECVHILEQDQSVVESRKRILWRPYKEPINFDYQDSHQRSGWIPNLRFQEGIQQNTYKTLQKHLVGIPYTSNNEGNNSPLSGFYYGKSTNLRGTIPILATQQWTKKAHISTSLDHNKNGQEDKDFQELETQKDNSKDLIVRHAIVVCETNVDKTNNINRAKKEHELRNYENNEIVHVAVPLAKVVASTGGNMATTSFNLNANLEDWPPLSKSCASIHSKNSKRYPLTSYQCDLETKLEKKLNIERGLDYQTRLESKVEGSNHSILPSTRSHVNYTTSGSVIVGRQRGILIGSVSVPLGDYMHQARLGIGSTSKRICTPLRANQSNTSIPIAPPVQYNQDLMITTIGQQKRHKEINLSEFEESSNMQVIDCFEGPSQYRTSTIRSTSCVNFNERHVKGPTYERTYIYPFGDREDQGIISKQPPWSNGSIRYVPQKIWRPIRSTTENVDSNASGRTSIEGNIINENEKIHTTIVVCENEEPLKSTNEVLSIPERIQVRDIDINKTEHCLTFTTNIKAQLEDKPKILDSKSIKRNTPLDHLDKSMVLDIQHLQCQNESNEVASITSKENIKTTCQFTKCNALEQTMTCIFENKINNMENTANKTFVETTLSNSAWIAEVVEYHLNRWYAAMKDPETIVSKCEVEHSKLQTSVWDNFIDNQPSLSTGLILKKENTHNRIFDSCDQISTKKSRNLQNEQMSTNTQNYITHEANGVGLQGALTDEEFQQDSFLACESAIDSTIVEVQNHKKNVNKGQIRCKCSNSCIDSNLNNNNNWTERRDWIGAMSSTIQERPQEK